MQTLVQVVMFIAAIAVVWYFAGVLVDAVSRIAKRFCKTGFFTAFFLLGFLTSISEMAVALNAGLSGVPGVSAGNLVGASFVLLLAVVPLLAIAGNSVTINGAVSQKNLFIILVTIALPAVLVIDGNVTATEGLLALLVFAVAAFSLFRNRESISACEVAEELLPGRLPQFFTDVGRVVVGAVVIFAASHVLVEQSVYFAQALKVPASLIGLVLLSLGTNIPEIVIAIRSIFQNRSDIALGDYLGSASINTMLFALLALGSGSFVVEASEFVVTAPLFVLGLVLLYLFIKSNNALSRREGLVLLLFYVLFLCLQGYNLVRLAG